MARSTCGLLIVLLCVCIESALILQGRAEERPRKQHLFVNRRFPLAGAPKRLQEVRPDETAATSNGKEGDERRVFGRVRRSLNPDNTPNITEVSYEYFETLSLAFLDGS